jgi:hypothetical protein
MNNHFNFSNLDFPELEAMLRECKMLYSQTSQMIVKMSEMAIGRNRIELDKVRDAVAYYIEFQMALDAEIRDRFDF